MELQPAQFIEELSILCSPTHLSGYDSGRR